MKLMLACNLEWPAGNSNADRIVVDFKAVGFMFRIRSVPNGIVASVTGPIEVELESMQDLIELQKKLGYPVLVEDGHLEVVL
jgi:hypothetical protein